MRKNKINKTVLNVKEASDFLRVTPDTVYKWAKRGKIPFIKQEGKVLFFKGDLYKMLLDKRKQPIKNQYDKKRIKKNQ